MTDTPAMESPLGMPRNYLRPCLLLLLAEGTSHGYELLDQMVELGIDRSDPGRVYRCLRAMDEEGLVHSAWEPSAVGPARRTYTVTDEGREWLHVLAGSVADVSRALTAYQGRYRTLLEQDEHVG